MPATQIPITGSVLDWAIAEAGLTTAQVANRLGVDPFDIGLWVQGDAKPSKTQFDRLCRMLGRSESFFFLAHPPPSTSRLTSFRNPPGKRDYRPTPEDLTQLRLAENVQEIATWLAERAEFQFKVVSATTADVAESVAARIRDWLSWSTSTQIGLTEYEAARQLRQRLEAQGIIALNLPLGEDGLRGFCMPHDRAPVIAINTKDDTRARLFSYIHECAHLSLGSQYLCREQPDTSIERWCDRVAGAVLAPLVELQRYLTGEGLSKVSTYEQVRKAANKFKISLRAMAVRLEQTQLGISGLFDLVDSQASDASRGGFGKGPPQTRARRRVQSYGAGYVGRLLDAARTGELRATDVQDLLNLSRKDYRELQHILAQGGEG